MKPLLKIFSMILIFCLSQQYVMAQDVIYKKGGKKMEVKVKEVGMDDIKYVELDDQDGVIRSIAKDAVEKIVYANGKTETFVNDFDNPEFYADQKNKAIKLNFFSPLTGFTELAYEQNLAPGRSIEGKLGIIGLGFNNDRNASGVYGGVSYKFYRTPDYYMRGMRYAHILKGGYFRPEIVFGGYAEDFDKDFNGSTERRDVVFGAIMLNLGKQWVFSDIFLLDLYFGGGYGFDSSGDDGGKYNYTNATTEIGLAGQVGFRIGVLLK